MVFVFVTKACVGSLISNNAADKEMALRIHEILHVIEEPYREVFWMRTFGELSFREIADIHKKSESWVG